MTVNNKIAKPRRILTNGDRERLGDLLRKRLIECGWKEQVRRLYRQVMRENNGETMSYETLLSKMTPRAHALVPDVIKKEFIRKIISCRGPRILKCLPKNEGHGHAAQPGQAAHASQPAQQVAQPAAGVAQQAQPMEQFVPVIVEAIPQME